MTPTNKQIVDKLEDLRSADPECLLFGVDTHRYRLGPRLSPADVESLEKQYDIVLPDDYAAFLIEIGNGGAGPGYGLQRFGYVHSVGEIPTAEPRGPLRVVRKTHNCTLSRRDLFDRTGKKVDPFDISLFDSIRNLAPDGITGPKAPRLSFPLVEPLRNAEPDAKWAALNPATGALMLADYGCAMTAHLVLNGPFRGHVWLYDPNASRFVSFHEVATLHHVDAAGIDDAECSAAFTFAFWYEHWINHALRDVSREYDQAT